MPELSSDNGKFTVSVTDGGITLSGPGGSVVIDDDSVQLSSGGVVKLFASSVLLGDANAPVLRVGDTILDADGKPCSVTPGQAIVMA